MSVCRVCQRLTGWRPLNAAYRVGFACQSGGARELRRLVPWVAYASQFPAV